MMEIEVEHKPEVYLQKCETIWELISQRNADAIKKYWILIVVILFFTILMFANGSGFGYITAILSILGIVYLLSFKTNFNKANKKYTQEAKEISTKYIESKEPIKWIFHDEYFGYKDFQIALHLEWNTFKGYQLKNNVLILYQSDKIQNAITIARDEVGEENFLRIIEFIKTKIK